MKNITIGFSRSSDFLPIFSWLIMLSIQTPYSHVYLKYKDEELNKYVYYQASYDLVNSMDSTTFLSQEKVIKEFNFQISDKSFKSIQEFMLSNAGKPYSVLEICGLALMISLSFFDINIQNPFKEAGKGWICDQLIAALLNECENIILPCNINNLTPKDVYNIVSKLPEVLS